MHHFRKKKCTFFTVSCTFSFVGMLLVRFCLFWRCWCFWHSDSSFQKRLMKRGCYIFITVLMVKLPKTHCCSFGIILLNSIYVYKCYVSKPEITILIVVSSKHSQPCSTHNFNYCNHFLTVCKLKSILHRGIRTRPPESNCDNTGYFKF